MATLKEIARKEANKRRNARFLPNKKQRRSGPNVTPSRELAAQGLVDPLMRRRDAARARSVENLRREELRQMQMSPDDLATQVRGGRPGAPIRNLFSRIGEKEPAGRAMRAVAATPLAQDIAQTSRAVGAEVARERLPAVIERDAAQRESRQAAMDVIAAQDAAHGAAQGAGEAAPQAGRRFLPPQAQAAPESDFFKESQRRGLRFLGLRSAEDLRSGREDPITTRNRAIREARTMGQREALERQFRQEDIAATRREEERGERRQALGMQLAGELAKVKAGDAAKMAEIRGQLAGASQEAIGTAIAGLAKNESLSPEQFRQMSSEIISGIGGAAEAGFEAGEEVGAESGAADAMDVNGDGKVDSADVQTAQQVMERFAAIEDPAAKERAKNSRTFIRAQAIMARMKKKEAANAARANV